MRLSGDVELLDHVRDGGVCPDVAGSRALVAVDDVSSEILSALESRQLAGVEECLVFDSKPRQLGRNT